MKQIIQNPVYGQVKDISECSDIVFSEKMLGDGFIVIPTNRVVVAPCTGEVITVSESKHAITMRLDNGVELLIHIGIDTVELKGQGFKSFVSNNQKVFLGEKLMEVDFDYILSKGYSNETIVAIVSQGTKLNKLMPIEEVNEYIDVLECE